MSVVSDSYERFSVYRKEVGKTYRSQNVPRMTYVLANIALGELKRATERAEEPTPEMFERVAQHFELAADTNDGVDQLASLRSQLLKAWIRPIVWSDIINLGALTSGEARHVAQNIGLGESADATALLTAEALEQIDEIHSKPKVRRTEAEHTRAREISGFLGEATPVLLGARHTTAKQFIVPSMAYDDSLNPNIGQHVDSVYFDNRTVRTKRRVPFQVETVSGQHTHIDRSIPIINARMLGTLAKASQWPKDDRPFVTTRQLVKERTSSDVSAEVSSKLDSIASTAINHILNHQA